MKNKKEKIIFLGILILVTICVAVGYSTAYFRANISYDEDKPEVSIITMSNAEVIFDGGDTVSLEHALPGDSISKTFTVKNDNETDQLISINFSNITNTFINNDIVYSLYEVDKDSKNELVSETGLPSTTSKTTSILDCTKIKLKSSKTYELVLTFKETDRDQSDNMGKVASTSINLEGIEGTSCPVNITRLLSTTTSVDGVETTSLEDTVVDETDDKNIRYVGENPNNYIWFNCEDYSNPTEDTCERWRIIGLMNNVSTDNGKESLVKIVRASFIGDYAWDRTQTSYSKVWETSTIKTLLNDTYYNNGTSTQYYGDSSPSTNTAAFDGTGDTKGITTSTKNLIQEVNWNVTSVDYLETVYNYYTTTGTTWEGFIGLIDPSDYGFATDGGTTTREICLNTTMGNNSGTYWGGSECYNNSWLYYSNPTSLNTKGSASSYWTNRPYSRSSNAALFVNSSGHVYCFYTYNGYGVRPALFLKSGVSILKDENMDGSYEKPYMVR